MLRALQTLLAHNLNQSQAMERAVVAKAQGLDPNEYGTVFPGATVVTTTNNNASGYIKGSLVAATLLAAGGGGAYLLKPDSTPKPVVPQPEVILKTSEYDAIYEVLQPDGTWKQIKRERLKP